MYFYYTDVIKFSTNKQSNIVSIVENNKQIIPEVKYQINNKLGINIIQPFLYLDYVIKNYRKDV